MRLIEFYPLGPYRNLRPRPIRFTLDEAKTSDKNCSIRFLVGRNGTGKTNLLRFVTSIFLALEENYRGLGHDSPAYNTPFDLVYELHGATIKMESKGKGRSQVQFTINGEKRPLGDIPGLDSILPQSILVYTSGNVTPWHEIFTKSENKAGPEEDEYESDYAFPRRNEEIDPFVKADDQSKPDPLEDDVTDLEQPNESGIQTSQRIYLTKPEHLPFALLVTLLHHQTHLEPDNPTPFANILTDVNVELISFSLRYLPNTDSNRPALSSSQRRLLRRLNDLATLKLQEWDKQRWVFDLHALDPETGKSILTSLAEYPLNDRFQFFQALVQLEEQGYINSLNLIVNHHPFGVDKEFRTLLTQNLSDGELAFISRMALIYLLREDECLFLLDEPETHFNDDWKRNLVDNIEQTLIGTNSEVILTSHASITLTDAFPDEVILLTTEGQEPIVPLTLAAEQGELLRSVFGAERSTGRRAMRHVDGIIANGTIAELEALLDQVGPGYYRFKIVKELQRRVPPDQQT